MVNYKGSRVVIIGLGLTGLSCVNFFMERGVVPRVMDIKLFPRYFKQLPKNVSCCFGSLDDRWILDATLIIISPSISLLDPLLIQAKKLGIEIISDIELFVREVNKPVIAITGSNGKSTVTTLLANMAFYAGLSVGVGGNIGLPALMLLNKSYQLYILELSSFQLEATYSLYASVATILNVTHDHMDRYPDGLLQYRTAKLRIFNNAKVCLINTSDPLTFPMCNNYSNDHLISFGFEYGDYYLQWKSGKYWLMRGSCSLLDCSKMKIFGYHNYMNALAALALADSINIPRIYSLFVLSHFTGLPHCLELVHINNSVYWINDSKSTNVNSTIAAIQSLPYYRRLHLLLGGYGKCADFSFLRYWIQKDNIHLYCFGTDAKHFMHMRSDDIISTDNMKQAMYIIANNVRKNDIVLLSPACSSLDQFENFKIRGYTFSYLARNLG